MFVWRVNKCHHGRFFVTNVFLLCGCVRRNRGCFFLYECSFGLLICRDKTCVRLFGTHVLK